MAKRNLHNEVALSDEGSVARTAKVKRGEGLVGRDRDLMLRERFPKQP